jgi:tetratricopeptide (TPR) repeat protein
MTLIRNLQDAASALQRRQPVQAERILRGILAAAPRNPDALRLLGLSQQQRGDYALAAETLRDALVLRTGDPVILNDLGNALRLCGDPEGAIAALREATQRAPRFATAWFNLGKTLKNNLYPEEACAALRQALDCDPDFAAAWGTLGDALKACGDIEGAVSAYRRGLRYPSHAAQTWYHLANLQTIPLDAQDVVALRTLLANTRLADDARIHAGYALAKALDDQHDYAEAFAALSAASALKRSRIAWDAARFSAFISSIEEAFAHSPQTTAGTDRGKEVIFVVSLPRSGSTLVEQIIASHSQVEGANELAVLPQIIHAESTRRKREFPQWVGDATTGDWQRLGDEYLARTERWRRNRPRFTDKGVANWQYVGAALAMLPGARVINCRRDAVEICFSCYRQLFAHGHDYSYDLVEMAACWRDYDRLSAHWRERYPRQVHEFVHERLQREPEAQIRELLEFLDMPFEPACVEFHRTERVVRTASGAQVRQPLRPSSAHAARYGTLLDPLRATLAGA